MSARSFSELNSIALREGIIEGGRSPRTRMSTRFGGVDVPAAVKERQIAVLNRHSEKLQQQLDVLEGELDRAHQQIIERDNKLGAMELKEEDLNETIKVLEDRCKVKG